MTNFNEHALEMSIMELFEEEQYEYIRGDKNTEKEQKYFFVMI